MFVCQVGETHCLWRFQLSCQHCARRVPLGLGIVAPLKHQPATTLNETLLNSVHSRLVHRSTHPAVRTYCDICYPFDYRPNLAVGSTRPFLQEPWKTLNDSSSFPRQDIQTDGCIVTCQPWPTHKQGCRMLLRGAPVPGERCPHCKL